MTEIFHIGTLVWRCDLESEFKTQLGIVVRVSEDGFPGKEEKYSVWWVGHRRFNTELVWFHSELMAV